MSKDWLIRTKDNKILGPVSRDKIIEFLKKKILLGDDEVSDGSGKWVWIREEDLLQEMLGGNENSLPSNEDLEFPED